MEKQIAKKPKIDEVDIKILKALSRDVRKNFAEIAKDCNLSITAITQRYRRMKKNGIITGTSLIVNLDSGDQHSLSVDIKAESGYEESIIEAIRKLPQLKSCFKVIGKYDIHAGIRVHSLEEIDNIKRTLQKIKGILEIDITISIDRLYFYPENLLLDSTADVNIG